MNRRESRELAFILLFEKLFTDESMDAIIEAAGEARDTRTDEFCRRLATGTEKHIEEIDAHIVTYSRKWNKNRISRVALTVMRLAMYEMQYVDEVPVSVSINEAVELAKKYGGEEDSSFVNGILGSVSRENEPETVSAVAQEPEQK